MHIPKPSTWILLFIPVSLFFTQIRTSYCQAISDSKMSLFKTETIGSLEIFCSALTPRHLGNISLSTAAIYTDSCNLKELTSSRSNYVFTSSEINLHPSDHRFRKFSTPFVLNIFDFTTIPSRHSDIDRVYMSGLNMKLSLEILRWETFRKTSDLFLLLVDRNNLHQ
jgi:hypothetical protein